MPETLTLAATYAQQALARVRILKAQSQDLTQKLVGEEESLIKLNNVITDAVNEARHAH
jgi:hypothetical protein